MEFMHGLELNLDNVNQILKIAQKKGYVKSNEPFFDCDNFKFDEKNHKFEFHVLPKHNITLDMDRFVECYTVVLSDTNY
jgi:hypothetical protein